MRVSYDGITFDSELEVEYYKYLTNAYIDSKVIEFYYHPKKHIQITRNNVYTPDFIVIYNDRVEIVETKGYNPYSKMRDDMIHQVMLQKNEEELRAWLCDNGLREEIGTKKVIYRKIKFLKAYGWVDFDFKNPNTLANQRKAKINELEVELKELKAFRKETVRFFKYKLTTLKPTKKQQEFIDKYLDKIVEVLNNDNQ